MSLLHPGREAFMAVVKHTSVNGAAAEIGLTQTGVTQRIRALERSLSTTLFTRSRKGMRPTREGETLHRYCQRVADLEGEYLSFLRDESLDQGIRINITGPSSMMRSRIIPGATRILEEFRNVTFTFHLDDDKPGLAYLKSGEAQLAVLMRHEVVNELDSKLLAPARYVLVASAAWKGRRLRDIVSNERIVDFNEADDATFRYLQKYGLFDLARKDRHLANNTDALAALVADGRGYSVLPADFARPLKEQGAIIEINKGKRLDLEFALAWYPRHEMPAYFARLVKEIK
jgi:LysR family transcriptional regulator (chromosome initiation inhibitor)